MLLYFTIENALIDRPSPQISCAKSPRPMSAVPPRRPTHFDWLPAVCSVSTFLVIDLLSRQLLIGSVPSWLVLASSPDQTALHMFPPLQGRNPVAQGLTGAIPDPNSPDAHAVLSHRRSEVGGNRANGKKGTIRGCARMSWPEDGVSSGLNNEHFTVQSSDSACLVSVPSAGCGGCTECSRGDRPYRPSPVLNSISAPNRVNLLNLLVVISHVNLEEFG